MTVQLLDTTSGAGDTGKVGGDKLNAAILDILSRANKWSSRVASRSISGKQQVMLLSNTNNNMSALDATTTGVTYNMRIASPLPFEAMRVLIPNLASAPVTGLKVGFAFPFRSGPWLNGTLPAIGGNIGQFVAGNPNNDTIGPVGNRFTAVSGAYGFYKMMFKDQTASEVDLPAAYDTVNGVASWTATDWTPCTPAARTDGGSMPLVDIRIQYPAAGTVPASGAASSSPGVTLTAQGFANWGIDGALEATRPFNGGQMWRCFSERGLGVDNGLNFQGSNTPQQSALSVPIIVQFRTLTDVVTVVMANDSISEYSDGEYANSYSFRGAKAASLATSRQFSWCPLSWPSGAIIQYGRQLNRLIDFLKPEVVWVKPIGPNDAGAPLSQNNVDIGNYTLGYLLDIAAKYNSKVIIEPYLSIGVTTGPYAFAATDSYRRALNLGFKNAAAARNFIFIDTDAAWNVGGSSVSGQATPPAANTTDGVHPSDVGHAVMTPVSTAGATTAFQRL